VFLIATMRVLLQNVEFWCTFCPNIVRGWLTECPSVFTILEGEKTSWGPWLVDSLEWTYFPDPTRCYNGNGKRCIRISHLNKVEDVLMGNSLINPSWIPNFVWGDFFVSLMKIS